MQSVAPGEMKAAFARKFDSLNGSGLDNPCPAGCAVPAAIQAVGTEFPALSQKRDLRISQQLNFTDQAIAAAKLPRAT
jgi:hypothetical protein